MAEFFELNDDIEGTDDLPEIAPPKADNIPDELDDLPEKYRNKSAKDLARMHQEAEKLIGKQAQEVGEVRKLADELIKKQLNTTPVQQKQVELELDDTDFFVDPKAAISKAISQHPSIVEARDSAERMKRMEAQKTVATLHPDFQELVSDPNFVDWVQSSKIRTQLYHQADAYDADAANELFSTYKELKGVKQKQAETELGTQRNKALKAADTGNGVATTSERSKKVYRRADIIRLMNTDPQRYAALQDEIMLAYSENRVK